MKKTLLTAAICTLLATTAHAGVKDKKAIKAAEAGIATEIAKVKTACGNAALEVNVSWDEYKAMIKANEAVLKENREQTQWIYAQGGQRTISTLESLAKICADDEDYKEEIANLTKVIVTPKAEYKDYKSEFTLDGTVLHAKTGHRMTRSASDFTKRLKALY
ncbi:hypothetical protein KO495_04785 [Colwellia sp. D2M02]|uniref:Lysozyme inhibitor LprI N-terminal domain-containing protein n=1 Tax=Colwellia asteriadis TaxID=517723 RepID=A0ABN1L880_9GAMM|nr:hypothetical protein [Colwellia sp. D2M02]MBU2892640.1 hypothetical protein [Colwellia sp. D2M02]